MVRETVAEYGGAAQATVIAAGLQTTAQHAGLANGVAIRNQDYNDVYFGLAWTAHASDNRASLLAVCEWQHLGGRHDLVASVIAQQLGPPWGQQVVVDNRAGAGGIVGTDLAAKAPADGYTWVMVSSSFVMTAGLQKSLPYDPVKDFAPVMLRSLYSVIVVAHPSVRATTLQELISLARRRPGARNFASSGSGTPGHLAGALFRSMTGVEMVHVP